MRPSEHLKLTDRDAESFFASGLCYYSSLCHIATQGAYCETRLIIVAYPSVHDESDESEIDLHD